MQDGQQGIRQAVKDSSISGYICDIRLFNRHPGKPRRMDSKSYFIFFCEFKRLRRSQDLNPPLGKELAHLRFRIRLGNRRSRLASRLNVGDGLGYTGGFLSAGKHNT